MKRPFLLRLLPNRLKQLLHYRYYRSRYADWQGLFDAAPLALTPHARMYGLLPGDGISSNIAFNGFYELALSKQIVQLARKGKLLVDVGANMGYFSLLWAGANLTGRVTAFEASPRNVRLLENNVALNGFSDRITVVSKAAGKRSGATSFDLGPADQTGWGGISSASSPRSISVPVVRIDQELPDVLIDVLKIDVEGADTWVLLGCEALLREKRICAIFYEQNKSRMDELGINSAEAEKFLKDVGYICRPFGGHDGEWAAFPNNRLG